MLRSKPNVFLLAILAGAILGEHGNPQTVAVASNGNGFDSEAIFNLCRRMGYGGDEKSCLSDLVTRGRSHALIATVPDPDRTNLDLYFDRSIEAIIWAVGDAGFTFADYWLPWKASPIQKTSGTKSGSPESDKAASTHSGAEFNTGVNSEPGFLLFRKGPKECLDEAKRAQSGSCEAVSATHSGAGTPDEFFVVWLVGESPTFGIEREPFRKAIRNVGQIGANRPQVRIVGPSFSGSFSSLSDVLEEEERTAQHPRFHVISGTATSLDAESDFRRRLPKVEFGTTVENASKSFCEFYRYLKREWIPRDEVAILAEDQTVYGQQIENIPCLSEGGSLNEKWLIVQFPREIARLRNMSEMEAGTSKTTPPSTQPLAAYPQLSFTLQGPADSPDNVPIFSKEHSPLSQEAVLLDIANALQHEHAKYAVIIATDVLDEIFLARFLRHACPDVRLILFDADLLMVRSELTSPLGGILNVTTYPLFLRNQHWTNEEVKGQPPRRIPFASRSEEGIYNATRYQLWNDLDTKSETRGEVMLDYSHPDSGPTKKPPLWLTVLGRTGYWPVAFLDELPENQTDSTDKSFLVESVKGPDQPGERLHLETPSYAWRIAVILVSFASLMQVLYIFLVYLRQLANKTGWKLGVLNALSLFLYNFFVMFPRYPQRSFSGLLVAVTLALASVEAVFATTGIAFANGGADLYSSASLVYFLLPACAFVCLLLGAVALSIASEGLEIVVASWTLWGAFMAMWLESMDGLQFKNMRVLFFAYRNFQPASEVSPALPVLFLIAVLCIWGLVQLSREAGASRPLVPNLSEPFENAKALTRWLNRIAPLGLLSYLLIAILYWGVVQIRSAENRWYDALISYLVAVSYFLMFSSWGQCWFSWWRLRRFLESLERHAMREAFSRLPKELSSLPLLRRGKQKPFLMASGRFCDTLVAITRNQALTKNGRLKSEYEARSSALRYYLKNLLHFRDADDRLRKGKYIHDTRENLQSTVLEISNALIISLRELYWCEGRSESLVLTNANDKPPALDDRAEGRVLGEELLALRFAMYIVYALDQMKKLMWFVVLSFVLTVIALNVYPFQSPRLIDFSSLAIFALLSIGTMIILAQMDRDSILSRLTATTPNQIGKHFYFYVARFGALPLITILSTQFPSVRNFLFSWIQPAIQALTNSG